MKITEVSETKFGVYVWQMPNGSIVQDEHRNVLSINSDEGNIKRISELQAAARQCGILEGQALFVRGSRQCSDEEHERQLARMKLGLIPDELDVAAFREEV